MNSESSMPARGRLCARVISLKHSVERRERIASNLSNLRSIDWGFFEALEEHSATSLVRDKVKEIRSFGRQLTGGEIGCYKSHFELLKSFVESNTFDWILVLEDDVFVDVKFDFLGVIGFLDRAEIGYLRLYAKRLKPFRLAAQLSDYQVVRFLSDPYGTQAYLVSRGSAKRFIDSAVTMDMPIDDRMGRYWSNGLVPYAVFPFPIIELCGASTIGQERSAINRSRDAWSAGRIFLRLKEKFLKTVFNYRLMTLGK